MTHTASGSRSGVPKGWLIPIGALVLILVAAAMGWLSKSIVIDFVAWWPVWLLLAGLAAFAGQRRWGRVRVSGLVPLLTLGALVVFVVCHLSGWDAMPSSSAALVGPAPGTVTNAALSARIEGRVDVRAGDTGYLYTVVPLRTGGAIGLAEAVERTQGDSIAVDLTPVEDPGLFTFSGWDLEIDPEPEWNLSLGGEVDADLSLILVTELVLEGEGTVTLPAASAERPVRVSGSYHLVVPAGAAVRVVGDALVPESWVETSDGWSSPAGAGGWVVSVAEGSTLEIAES